tara:strand:+ start:460 stop:672 length:213 start_codon:yes stop_codon:yes gene_type:complete
MNNTELTLDQLSQIAGAGKEERQQRKAERKAKRQEKRALKKERREIKQFHRQVNHECEGGLYYPHEYHFD